MQSEVILWGYAVKRAAEGWVSVVLGYEWAAADARRGDIETGHECGPVTRLVLPLPTDYPEPMR